MDKNEALIQEVYKNTKMGGDSIIDLIDRANDPKFRSEMTSELESYRRFSEEASRRLQERGTQADRAYPRPAKMGAKLGMAFNTLLDTTTSHLAELMINGATMGIIDLEKKLNERHIFVRREASRRGCAEIREIHSRASGRISVNISGFACKHAI